MKRCPCELCKRPSAVWGKDKPSTLPEFKSLCWINGGAECLLLTVENQRRALKAVGDVLAANGCDCDHDSDHDGTCEELGHEPCLAHRVERALSA